MVSKLSALLLVVSILSLGGCVQISGTVLLGGAGLEGVTVTLSGDEIQTAVTGSGGEYTFSAAGLSPGTYTITPSLAGFFFDPVSRNISFSGETVTGVDFAAEIIGFLDRRYDEVAYATTHNAMSNAEEGWLLPNQRYSMSRQLADGVRALMLDVWEWEGEIILCHGCDEWYGYLGGHKPLVEGLTEIRNFMDENPTEIVTILFESYVSFEDVENAFMEAGLYEYTHTQQPGDPWPTLNQMIQTDQRLVVFTDRDGSLGTWYHPVWSFAWETHWSAEYPEDLNCSPNRGSISNDLFILNHFLTRGATPKSQLAKEVNYNPFFVERALECLDDSGKLPNFITVDFYDIGDLSYVVNALNTL